MNTDIITSKRQQFYCPIVKRCSKCGEEKYLREFHKQTRNKGTGRAALCKLCVKLYAANYYVKNKPRIDDRNRLWADQNREQLRETRKTSDAKKYLENRETILKESRKKRRESQSGRKIVLARYGMTIEDYKTIFLAQSGVCAICREPETRVIRGTISALSVDHNHVTGKTRGLLCFACNLALGKFKDNIEIVDRALKYLLADQKEVGSVS